MNKYAQVLKKLFYFTGVKFMILANETGYNLSYISKWSNGTKLPSSKNIHRINEIAAHLFADEIMKSNRISDFFVEFHIPLPENKEFHDKNILYSSILELLDEAYCEAAGNKVQVNDEKIEIAIGNSEVRNMLHDVFTKENIANKTGFYEILISLPICIPISEYILDLIDKNKIMHIKMGLNKKEFEGESYKKIYHLYGLLSKNPNLLLELYSDEKFKALNLIVAKSSFALNFSMDEENILQMMTSNKNTQNIQKTYKIFDRALSHEDYILQAVDNFTLDTSRYRAGFYSEDYFHFLSVYGFEFLLPPEIIEKIAEKTYEDTKSASASTTIRKLKVAWEENFQTRHINFFILKSALLKYVEDGKLIYNDTRYQLSIEERLAHIQYTIKLMRKNPKINFYIIDDSMLNQNFDNFTYSVYVNKSKMYLKNNWKIIEKKEPFILIARDGEIIKATNDAFEHLKTISACKQYDADKLEEKWHKYEQMFLRIMQINYEK